MRRRRSSSGSRAGRGRTAHPPACGSQKRSSRFATVVLPAPDGPTTATVLPASTRDDTPSSAGRGRPGYAKLTSASSTATRAVPRARARGHAGPVGHGHRLGLDRVEPPRGAERVGQLAADLRDLPQRHEGRERQQRQQRQRGRVETALAERATRPSRSPPDRRDRSPSPGMRSGGRGRAGTAAAGRRSGAPWPRAPRPTRSRVRRRRSRRGPAPCPPRARSARRRPRGPRELSRSMRARGRAPGPARCTPGTARAPAPARPREGAEDGEHGERHQHRHQRRRHRVGEEVLDQLDVVGGHADQVAGAPAA